MQIDLALRLLQTEGTDPIPWWQVITGILAIPAAIIGLIYTYRLNKKTRLESQKLELEIREIEAKSTDIEKGAISPKAVTPSRQIIVARTQDFVTRYIIFSVTLGGWSLISAIIAPFGDASIAWLINTNHINVTSDWLSIFWLSMINQMSVVGNWVIYILFGWPLLTDIAASFGVSRLCLFRKGQKQN